MDLGLRNKVAMVAGASRGLGFGVARALAREGAFVSICSTRQETVDRAGALIKEETGGQVLAVECDVRSAESIERWYTATRERCGGVDAFFTNSGGPPAGAAMSFDEAAWRRASELLVFSVLRMIWSVVPSMMERGGGSILMSTSASVKEPLANLGLSTVM